MARAPPTTGTTTAAPAGAAAAATTQPGTDVKIPLPSFSDMLVDEARGRLYITGGKGTGTIVITDLDGSSLRPGQYTWAHTLVEGGLAWGPGNRFYAVTEQLSEPDIVTLRIRDVT